MTSSIGIKIANGEFYPVLEEDSTVRKRLVLTTVHDGQRSVQIDLYRSDSRSMMDAAYIGSLVVENIADKPKGEPSIELVIAAESADELSAEAADLDDPSAGSRQSLIVSLKAMNDEETYDVPDFELENEAASIPPVGLFEESEEEEEEPRRRRSSMLPIVVAVVLGLIAGAGIVWFLMFGRSDASPEPKSTAAKTEQAAPVPAPVPAKTVAAETSKPAAPAAAPVSKSEAAARRARSSAPVKSYKAPKTIPKEGFRYRIRWGDTLWDISEAFYRNPWLYPRIARFNKIRNPDYILAGAYIRVPPKN